MRERSWKLLSVNTKFSADSQGFHIKSKRKPCLVTVCTTYNNRTQFVWGRGNIDFIHKKTPCFWLDK